MELIGREAELALVADRLAERRLVTLVGPGGIGKTALARAAVAQCEERFPDGARFIDMTRARSSESVPESLAGQLGYASFGALIDAPSDLPVLLLVDNCEHVVDAVADVLDQLLSACRMPTVLATSRAPLELPDEVVVPVGPLELPPPGTVDAPAVRLFLERAASAGSQVESTDTLAELCRRLDGVPLAIELAAARARALAPAEILDRLGGGLDVLDRPRRRAARRHQSLRAAIGWSYDLLDPDDQELFEQLGIFAGPFTADLARAVAGADAADESLVQDRLDSLVAASMVVADTSGNVTWYRELETLRRFALDRLDERGTRREVETRFVDHVVTRVADIITRGASTWSADALADLRALYDNIAAAVRWCVAHDDTPDRAYVLTAALWGLIHQAHTEEIGDLCLQVLDRWPADDQPIRSDTIATAATCRYMVGDDDTAIAMAEAALADADRSPFAPVTLRRALAQANRAAGRIEGAFDWFTEMAEAARRLGLPALATEADAARSQILADLGKPDEAEELIHRAHREARDAGSELGAAWARSIEGSILLRRDPEEAERVTSAALDECRRLSYAAGTSINLRTLALADISLGRTADAAAHTLELLEELLVRGSLYELRLVCDTAAVITARAGREQVAADLAATALDLPVVSITASVGHELFPLDPSGGRVLVVRDAIVTAQSELRRIATGDTAEAPTAGTSAATGAGPRTDTAPHAAQLHRLGDVWEIEFQGEVTTVKATKGMADLARLLGQPGHEVHCLELVGAAVEQSDTGEVIDDEARRAYEARVRELQAEIDQAEDDHDLARAEKARAELDALVDHLTAALGLGRRGRTTGSSAERARSTVTQRLRGTIRRLDDAHPRLGRHLQASIRTGIYCAYQPEVPVEWWVEP